MAQYTILIVDDDKLTRLTLDQLLAGMDHLPTRADTGETALTLLKEQAFDLLISELHLQKMSGLDVLKQALEIRPALKVIVISGHPTLDEAVTAMKLGACDFIKKPTGFIQKPFTSETLAEAMTSAFQTDTDA